MAPFRSFSTISPADHGKEASLAGWVEDVRNLGGTAFPIVRQRDGTFQATIKKKSDPDLFDRASKVVRESVVAVRGRIDPNPQVRNGWELTATALDVLSPAAAPLPLPITDKVGAEMDTRFDNRPLDLRKPERRAIFRVRSVVAAAFRSFLDGHGFIEVQTPKLAGAGAEGGATLFETSYFGRRAFLSQSPQLYKQMLMSTGLDRVYEIAPAFRAEPSDTVRHVTEFTSFDGEVSWIERQEDFFPLLEGAVDAAIKPFYVMAKPDEPEYSFSFDLEYKGDEMASGGQREHRYDKLLARMKEKGLNPENFEFYLKAFRYGMPPHGGWGFGLDRFVQKLLDLPNIREAILFPRDRVRLLP